MEYREKFLKCYKKNEELLNSFLKDKETLKEYGIDLEKLTLGRDVLFARYLTTILYNKEISTESNAFYDFVAELMEEIKGCYKKGLERSLELYKMGIETADFVENDLVFYENFFSDLLELDKEEYSWWLYEPDSSFDGKKRKVYYIDDKSYNVESAKDFIDFNVMMKEKGNNDEEQKQKT
tara:strand:+ start:65 stop:604 length:540 start_codon:yes stop_codon:yes gene_type:complete